MPEKKTLRRARQAKAAGKAPSSQAGEFVREEIHHVREGKHGARSTKQAIAIGLSKARRAGVDMKPPKRGTTSEETRRSAERDYERSHTASPRRATSPTRARAAKKALKREGRAAASPRALSQHARTTAARRGASARKASARKAVRTKGAAARSAAAKKAARTRARA
jgi:hypothetical protein